MYWQRQVRRVLSGRGSANDGCYAGALSWRWRFVDGVYALSGFFRAAAWLEAWPLFRQACSRIDERIVCESESSVVGAECGMLILGSGLVGVVARAEHWKECDEETRRHHYAR